MARKRGNFEDEEFDHELESSEGERALLCTGRRTAKLWSERWDVGGDKRRAV